MTLQTQETERREGERAAVSSTGGGSNNINNSKNVMAHYNADASLMAEFEKSNESGKSFNYTRSVVSAPQSVSEDEITAYLERIQRGGFIQPFGCMLAIEEPTFKIIGYSKNCFDLLGLKSLVESKQFVELLGIDARTLFTLSARASFAKAVASPEISMLNPIWVHCRSNNKPFYAMLHRIDVGIVIDLEPARSGDPALLLAGAVQSQKLAVRAISRLQSLPGGDVGVLCDTVVQEVQKLTGYDRVMVYKFHDDDHGEILSEIRRSDLEPYLGIHYPATDIPQAARFLFMQNRVKMICDCAAEQVKIIQSEELKQPLCLVNSTLRAPHGCHLQYMTNMGSIASLVLAVVINGNDSMRLWGLVVCHHTKPRYVLFPIRYACEFLMQAFSVQLHMELQLASQLAEKKILRMQTLLCDMLLRDAPFGIVTQSPSIMHLVKCDGAAMYYGGKCWLLGVTPTEAQVKDIAQWLLKNHRDSTGLSTDSLVDAGYPGAALLGDAVCGMATARITSTDFLFWFKSHTAKEIKWGGAKHQDNRDDGEKLHPRSSFNAFLEVVKSKSLPWEVSEINAIHSLQLIMRDSLRETEENVTKVVKHPQQRNSDVACFYELSSVANEMVRLIETAAAPIFGVDSSGLVNGWNTKMAELTGLPVSEALGKSIITEIVHQDSRQVFQSFLHRSLRGEEDKNIEVKLQKYGMHSENSAVFLVVNACTSRDYRDNVVGVCFVGQDVTCEKVVLDKFIRLQGDYKAIVQSVSPFMPPIFAADENAHCSEWNAAMEKLTGWMRHDVIGKILPGEIFGGFCEFKDQDTLTKFMILLYRAISGQDTDKLQFSFLDRKGKIVEVFLTANKRVDKNGAIVGCFCFLQTLELDPQPSSRYDQEDAEPLLKLKELAYIRQEMKNPLNGIRFTHKLLEGMNISDDQKQLLETSDACERQIMSIIEDVNFGEIMEGSRVELSMEEFLLGNVIDATVSQVMILLKEKSLQLIHNIPEESKTLLICGDQIKLQLILSDFLFSIVHHAPSDGWVEIKVSPGLRLIQDGSEYIPIKFSLAHPGEGLPSDLTEEMSGGRNHCTTEEGIALNLSQKLIKMMNGRVSYIREQNRCHFLIELEFKTSRSRQWGPNLDLGLI